MSNITLTSLKRISGTDLSAQLLDAAASPKIAVVDVRDSDHIGGHIKGSIHAPANTLDWRIPELVRSLRDKETVVFHCALSQVRGPGAALKYLREREKVVGKGGDGDGQADGQGAKEQKVVVLDRGFVGWQEKYAEDEKLTEGYLKDIWEFGYQG